MEGATHLRCNPNTRVSITHTDNMGVAIPRLGRINPVPCRAHDIVIPQTFGQRIRKTRVKYPVFQREPAAPGKPKRTDTQRVEEITAIHDCRHVVSSRRAK